MNLTRSLAVNCLLRHKVNQTNQHVWENEVHQGKGLDLL